MKFENLNEGDIVEIKGEKHEFLYSEKEADVGTKSPHKVKPFTALILHKIDSKSITPTHELRYYDDKNQMFIFRIEQIERNAFSYEDKTKIDASEIKIVHKTH